jgi:ABC 3 transport family
MTEFIQPRDGVPSALNYDLLLMSALLEGTPWVYDGFRSGTLNVPLDHWSEPATLYHLHGSVAWRRAADGLATAEQELEQLPSPARAVRVLRPRRPTFCSATSSGASGSQLLVMVAIGTAVMGIWYRPLLFACIDSETAEARGIPVRHLGMVFLVVLALIVTGAARLVGTLLVLSLAITPDAAAQQLSASPLAADGLSILFAVIAADGGLLVSFETSNVKASVFITSNSFTIYLLARPAGPMLPGRRHHHRAGRESNRAARGAMAA